MFLQVDMVHDTWGKYTTQAADKGHLKMDVPFSVILNPHLWTCYQLLVEYIISATVISSEISSEGQELFIPIGVGIHLAINKDLTYNIS